MKNKQKGFTFIEILAVITLLSIMTLFVAISVSKHVHNARKKAYASIEETLRTATESKILKEKLYITNNTITATELMNGGYLQEIIDPVAKEPCDPDSTRVIASKESVATSGIDESITGLNEKINYTVCLVCPNYKTNGC